MINDEYFSNITVYKDTHGYLYSLCICSWLLKIIMKLILSAICSATLASCFCAYLQNSFHFDTLTHLLHIFGKFTFYARCIKYHLHCTENLHTSPSTHVSVSQPTWKKHTQSVKFCIRDHQAASLITNLLNFIIQCVLFTSLLTFS